MAKLKNILKKSSVTLFITLCLAICLPVGDARAQFDPNQWNPMAPFSPSAPPDGENCNIYTRGSQDKPAACPTGTRNDIDPTCLRQQNNSSSSCINTMPVGGTVSRVPEDVCERGVCNNGQKNCPYVHNGMDYAATTDADVLAAAEGVVIEANMCSGGYGIKVVIKHGKGGASNKTELNRMAPANTYQSIYGHMSKKFVSTGDWVTKNQVIGKVGGTNCINGQLVNSYGNHPHFAIQSADGTQMYDPMCSDIQGLCGGSQTLDTNCRTTGTPSAGTPSSNSPASSGSPAYDFSSAPAAGPQSNTIVYVEGQNEKQQQCDFNSYRSNYYQDGDSNKTRCVFCSVFLVLFNTASTIAERAFKTFAEAIRITVILAFAVWIGVKVMGYVSSMEVKEPRAMIKELLSQAFIVMGVYMLLQLNSLQFQKIFITPIFMYGFDLATAIALPGEFNAEELKSVYKVKADGGLDVNVGNKLIAVIYAIQVSLMDVFALGSTAWCLGFRVYSYKFLPIFPHLGFALIGVTLWLGAIILMCIYPFLLIDTVLQMAIAVGLIPVTIGCAAFKATRKYVKTTFDSLMNVLFNFLFLTIILTLIITLLFDRVGNKLIESVGKGSHEGLLASYAFTGIGLLEISFIMLLGWAVLGEGKKFADKFAKGMSIEAGSQVGGMAASAATTAAKKGWKGAKAVGGKAIKAAKFGINKAKIGIINKRFKKGMETATAPVTAPSKKPLADTPEITLARQKLAEAEGNVAQIQGKRQKRMEQLGKQHKSLGSKEAQDFNKKEVTAKQNVNQRRNELNDLLAKQQSQQPKPSQQTPTTATDPNAQYQVMPDGRVLFTPENGRAKLYTGTETGDSAELTKFVGNKQVDKKLSKSVNETTQTYASGMKRTEYNINTTSIWGDGLVDKTDGSLNAYNIDAIGKNSSLSPDVVNGAIMQKLIETQLGGGMAAKMNAMYKERDVKEITNKDGTKSFQISQIDDRGNITRFRMTQAGGRAMVEVITIASNGKTTHVQTDGIMKKTSTYTTRNNKMVEGSDKHAYELTGPFKGSGGNTAYLLKNNNSLFTAEEQKEGAKQINGKTPTKGEGKDDEKDRRPDDKRDPSKGKYTIPAGKSFGSQSVGDTTVSAVTKYEFSRDVADGSVSASPQIDSGLKAPIKAGDKIGSLKITLPDGSEETVDLVANKDVK